MTPPGNWAVFLLIVLACIALLIFIVQNVTVN